MITDPDPNDRPAVLAALRAKLADVARRMTLLKPTGDEAQECARLFTYLHDLQDAIWEIEQELGMVSYPMGWTADALQSG